MKHTPPIRKIPSTAVGVVTARLLFDLVLQNEADFEYAEAGGVAEQLPRQSKHHSVDCPAAEGGICREMKAAGASLITS